MVLTEYTLRGRQNLRIALVSDLHAHRGDEIIPLLKKSKPDLICCPGDMLERSARGCDPRRVKEKGILRGVHFLMGRADKVLRQANAFLGKEVRQNCTENTYRFFREAAAIAPVFYSTGNHEWYLTEEDRSFLSALNITVLENSHCRFGNLAIGGLSSAADPDWLREFAALPGEKLLLCHHPEYYDRYVKGLDIDLVLSGHAHGGQVRIKGHGIFAPNQGFFPRYTRGIYDGRLIVSAGCANTVALPRWGNPTETVLIDIRKEDL